MVIKRYEELKDYKRVFNSFDNSVLEETKRIIDNVRTDGDKALLRYSRRLDGVKVEEFSFEVSDEEIEEAIRIVKEKYREIYEIFLEAAKNIKQFHEKQKVFPFEYSSGGSRMGMKVEPLSRVLAYVPGGKASYPSTVLMNVIPAKVAGVNEVFMTTPPGEDGRIKNPLSVALAIELGVNRVYKIGGAHAIAAFAFGTESIPSVAKIVGPGNIYVATAKRLVSGIVGIDSIAGPSEVVTFADESADPEWVAIDLCAQAEHTGDNTVVLISTSLDFIRKVEKALEKILPDLKRKELIQKSLDEYAMAVYVEDYQKGFDIINTIAPEHVEVMINMEVDKIVNSIKNAGAIFIGNYTPVALGDYYAGPNHVIPTNGTAVFSSPLGVYDFVKRISYLCVDEEYISQNARKVSKMAEFEDLEAHSLSVLMRIK